MKKFDFIAASVAFHAALLVVALLLPPPFPSMHTTEDSGYTVVELRRVKEEAAPSGAGHQTTVQKAETGITVPIKFSSTPKTSAGPLTPPSLNPSPTMGGGAGVGANAPPRASAQPQPPAPAPKPEVPPEAPKQEGPQPAAQPARETPQPVQPPKPADTGVSLAVAEPGAVTAEKSAINFKYQQGWPVPSMVRVRVDAPGGAEVPWRAETGDNWIILSSASGNTPDVLKVGVDTSRLPLGYHEGAVRILPGKPGMKGDEVAVSVMILPKSQGASELPHSAWDPYMNGDCKVCHLPKELLPSGDFMVQPEFCGLCHNPAGMAPEKTLSGRSHPVMVEAGKGGTKFPTLGTVPSGPKSDRMASHLKDGKLIVCVTCHNVMEKPGDYGRTWEITSTRDQRNYYLYKGGWEDMGYMEPKVYTVGGMMGLPRYLKDIKGYLVNPSAYTYDEAEGVISFRSARKKAEMVYVTLYNPYLRVTTENNRLCLDCHSENTHQGLNCLACHKAHGTTNIKCIRSFIRTPDKATAKVVFKARKGKGSFADGDGVMDGICEVCHTVRHAGGKDYSGTDCTSCHSHRNGFGT